VERTCLQKIIGTESDGKRSLIKYIGEVGWKTRCMPLIKHT